MKKQKNIRRAACWCAALALCGALPLATAHAAEAGFDEPAVPVYFYSEEGRALVVPAGEVYGIRLSADGVIVCELTQVYAGSAAACPAQEAGLRPGDCIVRVNDEPVEDCLHFTRLLAQSGGEPLHLLYRRDGREQTAQLTPALCDDGVYRAGIWIRDGVSGIGTLTFVDPQTGVYGSLGHGICDAQSGALLPCGGGELTQVELGEVVKGTAGEAGELTGAFVAGEALGDVRANTERGVYGHFAQQTDPTAAIEVARRDEVTTGPVEILADPTGQGPQLYTAEIERVNSHNNETGKNFVLHVTDERLLALTGGIVQGMSGSPVLQNGRLAGAVTHVFLDDATRGYGIFLESMLETAEQTTSLAA